MNAIHQSTRSAHQTFASTMTFWFIKDAYVDWLKAKALRTIWQRKRNKFETSCEKQGRTLVQQRHVHNIVLCFKSKLTLTRRRHVEHFAVELDLLFDTFSSLASRGCVNWFLYNTYPCICFFLAHVVLTDPGPALRDLDNHWSRAKHRCSIVTLARTLSLTYGFTIIASIHEGGALQVLRLSVFFLSFFFFSYLLSLSFLRGTLLHLVYMNYSSPRVLAPTFFSPFFSSTFLSHLCCFFNFFDFAACSLLSDLRFYLAVQ